MAADRSPSARSALLTAEGLQVSDRVERLACDSERSRWGSITSRADIGGDDDWLVVDNDGITHLDSGADLAHPRRSL